MYEWLLAALPLAIRSVLFNFAIIVTELCPEVLSSRFLFQKRMLLRKDSFGAIPFFHSSFSGYLERFFILNVGFLTQNPLYNCHVVISSLDWRSVHSNAVTF